MKTMKSLETCLKKLLKLATKAAVLSCRKIWWRRKLILLEARMTEPSEQDKSTFSHTHIRLLNSFSSEELFSNFAQHSKLFEQRIEQGLLGWGIFEGNTPIGFLWIATKNYYEPALRFPIFLTPDEVYMFDGTVYKEHRKGAAPHYVARLVWQELLKQGFTTCISLVNEQNRRALLLHYGLKYNERFLQVVSPLLLGRPLRASAQHYSTPLLTRRALVKNKK